MRRLNSRGDTIVEVLVALAVTSALLAAAFTTSNQSLRGAGQSQERGEALKVVEAQAESLRLLAVSKVGFDAVTSPKLFCLNPASALPVVTGGPDPVAIGVSADPLSAYPAACQFGAPSNRYHIVISRPTGDSHLFAIYCRWPSIGGGANQELVIRYSVY